MITQEDVTLIKTVANEFLDKMTLGFFSIEAKEQAAADTITLDIRLNDPQMLIGQNGQTLFELQRILRILLNKKLQKSFYVDLDINDYKKNKVEYLKKMAHEAADEVVLSKQPKTLPPMPSYERLIIHKELAAREDVTTQSQGEGVERCVAIIPR